jgi:nucleoid-associated protein YgaU
MGVRSTERDRAIERAMRAHPAGRALRGGGAGVPPAALRPVARGPVTATVRPAPAPRVRLTARGRLVVAVLGLTAVTGVAAGVGPWSGGAPAAGLHLEGQSSVVVQPGDTLWSIASPVAGDDDVRDVVRSIQQVNGLRGTTLVPGEVLRLP